MLCLFKLFCFGILTLAANNDTNKIGNGGNVVACPKEKTLLDFYESGLKAPDGESYEKILRDQLLALKKIAPKLADQYLNRSDELAKEIEFKKGVILTDTADSKHLFRPLAADCTVVQTAIRRARPAGGEKRFLFREDIWEGLSPGNRAGLILHEIIHEHLTRLGEEDSVKARKINAAIFGKDLKKENFWSLVKDLRVPIYP